MALDRIKKYITMDPRRRAFQTRVTVDLLNEVNSLREKDGLSWQQLVEALFKRYRDESRKEKPQ